MASLPQGLREDCDELAYSTVVGVAIVAVLFAVVEALGIVRFLWLPQCLEIATLKFHVLAPRTHFARDQFVDHRGLVATNRL